VTVRGKTLTNIVEFREYKIVYRQYAGLVRGPRLCYFSYVDTVACLL
jgi:hypothetical protein